VSLLGTKLPNFDHALEKLPTGRVSGVVMSSVFEPMDHAKRQEVVWRILHDGLTVAELSKVGAIAALTPDEASVSA
jgi:hypothetical protein